MNLKSLTLIEMVLVMSLFILVLSLLFPIVGIRGPSLVFQTRMDLIAEARNAINNISSDLLSSNSIVREDDLNNPGNSVIRFRILNIEPNEEISRIPAGDPFGDISWGDGLVYGNWIRYRLVNGNLVRERLSFDLNVIETKIVGRNVDSFLIDDSRRPIYTIRIAFRREEYLGIRLPEEITYSVLTCINTSRT